MNSTYEIKQLQVGYDIIRYDGSDSKRKAGNIHVFDEESMSEVIDAMRKARLPFKLLIENAPRPKDLEKLVEKLLS